MTGAHTYDEKFYNTIKNGCLASAEQVVPRVIDVTRPGTVIDVGCGEGWWLSEFAKWGCEVTGVDGDYVDRSRLAIPEDRFRPFDLAHTRLAESKAIEGYDLAISLEVAEHLPPGRADTFVQDLCNLSDVVLFSAALPRQGGAGHINEQWPQYWVEKFLDCGFDCSGALRWEFWNNDRVENWYRQNLMLCVNAEYGYTTHGIEEVMWSDMAPMWPVIHPVLWDARTT